MNNNSWGGTDGDQSVPKQNCTFTQLIRAEQTNKQPWLKKKVDWNTVVNVVTALY